MRLRTMLQTLCSLTSIVLISIGRGAWGFAGNDKQGLSIQTEAYQLGDSFPDNFDQAHEQDPWEKIPPSDEYWSVHRQGHFERPGPHGQRRKGWHNSINNNHVSSGQRRMTIERQQMMMPPDNDNQNGLPLVITLAVAAFSLLGCTLINQKRVQGQNNLQDQVSSLQLTVNDLSSQVTTLNKKIANLNVAVASINTVVSNIPSSPAGAPGGVSHIADISNSIDIISDNVFDRLYKKFMKIFVNQETYLSAQQSIDKNKILIYNISTTVSSLTTYEEHKKDIEQVQQNIVNLQSQISSIGSNQTFTSGSESIANDSLSSVSELKDTFKHFMQKVMEKLVELDEKCNKTWDVVQVLNDSKADRNATQMILDEKADKNTVYGIKGDVDKILVKQEQCCEESMRQKEVTDDLIITVNSIDKSYVNKTLFATQAEQMKLILQIIQSYHGNQSSVTTNPDLSLNDVYAAFDKIVMKLQIVDSSISTISAESEANFKAIEKLQLLLQNIQKKVDLHDRNLTLIIADHETILDDVDDANSLRPEDDVKEKDLADKIIQEVLESLNVSQGNNFSAFFANINSTLMDHESMLITLVTHMLQQESICANCSKLSSDIKMLQSAQNDCEVKVNKLNDAVSENTDDIDSLRDEVNKEINFNLDFLNMIENEFSKNISVLQQQFNMTKQTMTNANDIQEIKVTIEELTGLGQNLTQIVEKQNISISNLESKTEILSMNAENVTHHEEKLMTLLNMLSIYQMNTQSALESLKSKLDFLQANLTNLSEIHESFSENSLANITDLFTHVENLAVNITALEQGLLFAINEIDKLENDASITNASLSSLSQDIQDLKDTDLQLQEFKLNKTELEEVKEQLSDIQLSFSTFVNDESLEIQLQNLSNKFESFVNFDSDYKRNFTILLGQHTNDITSLQEDLDMLKNELFDFKIMFGNVSATSTSNSETLETIISLANRFDLSLQELEIELKSVLENLAQQTNATQSNSALLATHSNALSIIESQLSDNAAINDEQNSKLQSLMNDLSQISIGFNQLNSSVIQNELSLSLSKGEINKTANALSQLESKLSELMDTLIILESTSNETEQDVADLQTGFNSDIGDLKAQLANVNNQLALLEQLKSDSAATCKTLTEITSLTGDVASTTQRRWFLEDLKAIQDPLCSSS